MLAENIVIGKDTKYPLKGILTLPENAYGPVPAVVLVHGSGSSNMDEKVGKLTPFKDIAEVRLKNPDSSLSDLGKLLDPPISKSGAAHRMKQIMEESEKI